MVALLPSRTHLPTLVRSPFLLRKTPCTAGIRSGTTLRRHTLSAPCECYPGVGLRHRCTPSALPGTAQQLRLGGSFSSMTSFDGPCSRTSIPCWISPDADVAISSTVVPIKSSFFTFILLQKYTQHLASGTPAFHDHAHVGVRSHAGATSNQSPCFCKGMSGGGI